MWMKNAETGGVADLPDLPYWRAQGWEPTDGPPPEPSTLRDPLPHADPVETTEAPDAEAPGLSAAQAEPPAEKPAAAKSKKESDRA